MKYACLTLDLETDYAGNAPEAYDGLDTKRIQYLLGFLSERNIPLTVFIVGKLLETHPESIALFQKYGCEFHLHSYSHNRAEPDSANEIRKGTLAFRSYFGSSPKGYRAPEGRISRQGLRILSRSGFLFDASVFPSFWPSLRYLSYVTKPKRNPEGIWEIPFAVVSPVRLIVSLSWIKLLGWSVYERLITWFGLPENTVFNIHMHDLWQLPLYGTLAAPWRFLYGRNKAQSFAYLDAFITVARNHGYSFVPVSRIVGELTKKQRL